MLHLADGRRVKASTVVVATGARTGGGWEGVREIVWSGVATRRVKPPSSCACKNLDAGARAESRREHVAVSHRPHRGDRQYRSIDPDEIVALYGTPEKQLEPRTLAQ